MAAAARPPQESNFEVEGTVTKQSAGKLTLDSGQGMLFRVVYDDKTAIAKQDGSAGSEKDLTLGIKIHVTGDLQTSGEIKAQRIEIEGRKPPVSRSFLRHDGFYTGALKIQPWKVARPARRQSA